MTTPEHEELNIEIHKIMGWHFDSSRKCWHREGFWTVGASEYTTDPALAMEVLQKCLEKTEQEECIYIGKTGNEFLVGHALEIEACAETLPLALAEFAKKLFTL